MRAFPIPGWWERLIQRHLKRRFYPQTRKATFSEREGFTEGDFRFFVTGVRKLNEYFTVERSSLPRNYFNQKELRSGYAFYFLPVNALKVASLLSQVFFPGKTELRILDLGSGPGTSLLGGLSYFARSPRRLHWTLVDQNREILKEATALHDEILQELSGLDSSVKTVSLDLSHELPRGSYDLILAVNLLDELPATRRVGLVENLLRRSLNPGGRLLIIEPALQRVTRGLMALHDEILEREAGFIYAPCLHQAACPMLAANRRDWCHTYLEWNRPGWIEKIDHLVGIRKEHLKCSYLLLGREPPTPVAQATWRVVSGHINSKGKSELLLCGPAALPDLRRLVRLDRHADEPTSFNRTFDRAGRGDLIQL